MSSLVAPMPMLFLDESCEDVATGVSETSSLLRVRWIEAQQHFAAPISRASVAQRFADLAATWQEERGASSSFTDMVLADSYQRIIGLGPKVVPSILVELAAKPDHWFWALHALTGANPISDEEAGNLRAMTTAWLKWGEEQGLLD